MLTALLTYSLAAVAVQAQPQPTHPIPARPDVSGSQVALSSDHPLATAAGAAVLREGGNAMDAAVTMAAVLSVVRPHMNGVGGDGFMLYREARTGRVYALNGSGRSGSRATPALFAERKLASIPQSGILSVSVPGSVRMWQDALERFGSIKLPRALAPAIGYASQGFAVSNRLHADIGESLRLLAADPELARTYLVDGRAPAVGSLLRQADLAATLRTIAEQGPDAFYRRDIARKIVAYMEREGGLLTAADLAKHTSTWQEPIESRYRGHVVLAFPPNTQGLTLLQQLNLADLADVGRLGHNSADYIHTLVEGARLAYADRDRHVTDPQFSNVPVQRLISTQYAVELQKRIGPRASVVATDSTSGDGNGDTIYLCVVDKDGNAVSWIQSNFASFGSGKMVPGTGIVLHNRGALHSLDPSHANVVALGKRPYHTLTPHMVLNADRSLALVVGTPGGDGQTQTVAQVINNVLLFGMTPQQAVEAPRWRAYPRRVGVEPGIAADVRDALTARGHVVRVQPPSAEFGGAQAIRVLPSGARLVGSDFRREAYGLAW